MAPAKMIPKMPSSRNQDPAHVMDFPSLNLGHAPCSKKHYTLVDLDVTVYGLEEIKGSDKPVAAVVRPLSAFSWYSEWVLMAARVAWVGEQCRADGEHVLRPRGRDDQGRAADEGRHCRDCCEWLCPSGYEMNGS